MALSFRGHLQVVTKGIISVLLSGNAVKEEKEEENQGGEMRANSWERSKRRIKIKKAQPEKVDIWEGIDKSES